MPGARDSGGKDALRWRLEAGLAQLAVGLVCALPERAALRLGALGGRAARRLSPRHRERARTNMRIAFPDWSEAQLDALLRRNFSEMGRIVVEWARHSRLSPEALLARVEFAGIEHLEKAIARGRGALVVTAHYGHWELIPSASRYRLPHIEITPTGRTLQNPWVQAMVASRRNLGGGFVLERDTAEIIRALRRNAAVGILVDLRRSRKRGGILVPFLGRRAWTTHGPATIARRTGAALIPAFTRRIERRAPPHRVPARARAAARRRPARRHRRGHGRAQRRADELHPGRAELLAVGAPALAREPRPSPRSVSGRERQPMIELERLSRRYGAILAVEDLSLQVARGELLVLLGGSGSGKTTTLKMVNRLIEPTGGRVRIAGRDTRELPAHVLRRGIGYSFQQVGLFPHLSVARNVAITPQLLGWSAPRIAARVDELLELVELEPSAFRDRRPDQLSGGEQQRVGLARALAAEPEVVLLDEPFGALDPLTRDRLQGWFGALRRRLGFTAIFVTHDMVEALVLGDRIAVLNQGRLEQVGTPAELLNAPASAYVAELMATPRRQAAVVDRFLAAARASEA